METISIIIPCYNEEEAIPVYYETMVRQMNEMEEQQKVQFELIFVDDGSKDHSLFEMRRLAQKDMRCRYLSFSRNFGKEAAMYAGLQAAKGDYVTVMDVDLQDPPFLLPKMYAMLQSGTCDCVAARRSSREGEGKIKSFLSNAFYSVINRLSKTEIVSGARDYRLMSRKMVDAVLEMSEYNRFSKGIFGWVGFHTEWLGRNIKVATSKAPCVLNRRHHRFFRSPAVTRIRHGRALFPDFDDSDRVHYRKNVAVRRSRCGLAVDGMHPFSGERCTAFLHGHCRHLSFQDIS